MNSIESNFVPYQIAVDMKSIGFDEPCFQYENLDERKFNLSEYEWFKSDNQDVSGFIKLPTYQAAFRWFREKYNLYGTPVSNSFSKWKYRITSLDESIILEHGCDQKYWIMGGFSYTYEETELACLEKLIQIVKK